jgi:hypothetical protein
MNAHILKRGNGTMNAIVKHNTTVSIPLLRLSVMPSRVTWMRLNRMLAWAIIVSPIVQIALRTDVWNGFLFDLGVVAAHGILSLILFGMPKGKNRRTGTRTYLFGLKPAGMSARNQFLLSGYRIMLAMVMILAACLPVPGTGWLLFVFGFYMLPRLPVSIVQHMFNAMMYAFQRWGVRKSAEVWSILTILLYFYISFANMLRPMFH